MTTTIEIVNDESSNWNNIYLIGYMGTGKSSVAKSLGVLLNRQVIDLDSVIEDYYGKSIPEIFDEIDEDGFRAFETLVLATSITGCHVPYDLMKGAIFSCGGGVPLSEVNVLAMRNTGKIILLTASPETVLTRLKDDETRPLLKKNLQDIEEMMELRKQYYEDASDIIIETDKKSPDDIAGEIAFLLDLVPIVS